VFHVVFKRLLECSNAIRNAGRQTNQSVNSMFCNAFSSLDSSVHLTRSSSGKLFHSAPAEDIEPRRIERETLRKCCVPIACLLAASLPNVRPLSSYMRGCLALQCGPAELPNIVGAATNFHTRVVRRQAGHTDSNTTEIFMFWVDSNLHVPDDLQGTSARRSQPSGMWSERLQRP
jgi:hypothetical protein